MLQSKIDAFDLKFFAGENGMKEDPVVFIKELSEQDRPFMLNHFLGLSPADRRLRFGAALPDEAVTKYVNAIDFDRDTIFGSL